MSSGPRPALAPGASRKRKEGGDALEALLKPSAAKPRGEPAPNRLLAGYLAHEFLTRGTLLGRKWDPAQAEASSTEQKARSSLPSPSPSPRPSQADQDPSPSKPKAYADVAHLLKDGGAHIPGIVNPTQLVQWLQEM